MNKELKVVEVSISRAERDEYLKSVDYKPQASLDKYDDYFALPVATHDEIREKIKAARAAAAMAKE